MAGVIDKNGIQLEHCSECGTLVRLEHLKYGYSPKWGMNADLCALCYHKAKIAAIIEKRKAGKSK